jgi:hypothetical protein
MQDAGWTRQHPGRARLELENRAETQILANVWDTGGRSDTDDVNETGRREVTVLKSGSPSLKRSVNIRWAARFAFEGTAANPASLPIARAIIRGRRASKTDSASKQHQALPGDNRAELSPAE